MTQFSFSSLVSGNLQRISLVTVGAIAFALGSCTAPSATSEADSTDTAASEDVLQVVTTFLPITQFTNAVAGDRAEVVQLLPTNTGVHDYQATPGDAQAIANADVLIQNGLEIEFFLDDMIDNAGNAELVIIDSSEGLDVLAFADEHDDHGHGEKEEHDDHGHAEEKEHDHEEEHAHGDEHDHEEEHAHGDEHDHEEEHAHGDEHDHAEGEAHAEGEEHGDDHDHHGHAHGEYDPHVWLDPKLAIEQVENIRDGLIAADPEGEAEYTANAEAFIAELEALDAEITEKLAPFEGQTFVVFHDFAGYFAESYGLESETLVGIPEDSPSPEDVKRVMETVKAEGLKTVLTEPQVGGESFDAIASDLDISVSVFDPLETGDAEAVQPEYYLTIMRQNADNLAASFGADQAWLPIWVSQSAAPQQVGLRF